MAVSLGTRNPSAKRLLKAVLFVSLPLTAKAVCWLALCHRPSRTIAVTSSCGKHPCPTILSSSPPHPAPHEHRFFSSVFPWSDTLSFLQHGGNPQPVTRVSARGPRQAGDLHTIHLLGHGVQGPASRLNLFRRWTPTAAAKATAY